jgi:hypothetical protein
MELEMPDELALGMETGCAKAGGIACACVSRRPGGN